MSNGGAKNGVLLGLEEFLRLLCFCFLSHVGSFKFDSFSLPPSFHFLYFFLLFLFVVGLGPLFSENNNALVNEYYGHSLKNLKEKNII